MSVQKSLVGVLLLLVLIVPVVYLSQHSPETFLDLSSHIMKQGRMKGPLMAPVHIIEYSNFGCHLCQEVQGSLQALMDKYPNQIRLEFRHFPHNSQFHSMMAHVAAEAAAEQNRFWDYHDRLFKEQIWWSAPQANPRLFIQYAEELGLDMKRFGRVFRDMETLARVKAEHDEAQKAGVYSTPTFFIQKHMVVGPSQFYEEAERWIQEALQKK